MKTVIVCLILSHYCLCFVTSATVESTITLPEGKITGKPFATRSGRQGLSFLGIPYAKTPLRFQAAEPPVKWTGVRDASNFGSVCPQYKKETKEIVGAEDCLFINVYTPLFPTKSVIKNEGGKLLPVMVYIHGGSFLIHSGNKYSPKYLLDEDMILVTFNYRLGSLGFLNTGDKESVPNLGMKDQVMALKWVQERIASFGGDKTKVTLMGSSAGAAAVSYHLLSPMSKGLFNSAIAQSGSALCPWALVHQPEKVAYKLGDLLGCSNTTSAVLMTCLKTKDYKEITEKQQKLTGWSQDPSIPFALSVETSAASSKSPKFLPDFPEELYKQGKVNPVPLLTGVNSIDGLGIGLATTISTPKGLERLDQNWAMIAPAAFDYTDTTPNPTLVSSKIRDFYFGKKKLDSTTKQEFVNAMSDRHFFNPIKMTAVLHSKVNPVYLYYFTHESDSSVLGTLSPKNLGLKGIAHVEELQYFFPLDTVPEIKPKSQYSVFSSKLIKLWLSFAIEGKPTNTWAQETTWRPLQTAQFKTDAPLNWYNIDVSTKSIEEPFFARLQFWNSLPLTSNPTKAGTGASSNATTTTTKKPGFFSKIIG